jgi:hypothetical protein
MEKFRAKVQEAALDIAIWLFKAAIGCIALDWGFRSMTISVPI